MTPGTSQCPACKVSVLPGAVFCTACGFRFQNVAAPAPPPMAIGPLPPDARRICPGCGAIAPNQRDHCSLCATPFGPMPVVIPPRPDGSFWALVWECDFQCRGCGLKSPLDSLDVDGEVECRRCGLAQAFAIDQWEEGLALAHNVADLAGPATPGSRAASVAGNRFASIGIKDTYAESQLTGMVINSGGMQPRSLRVRASTGSPLCKQCRAVLDVQIDPSGQAVTTCARCNDRATYAAPSAAKAFDSGVLAVLADEHRTDRPAVRVQASPGGGAIAITCPSCNAALPATAQSSLVTCPYCRTMSRIPSKTYFKMREGEAPTCTPWWILFSGPSPLRKSLLEKRSRDDDDDDDEKIPQIRIDRRAARDYERASRNSQIGGFIGALFAAGLGVGIYYYIQATKKRVDDDVEAAQKKANKNDDDDLGKGKGKAKAASKAPALERGAFRDLSGCTCKAGAKEYKLAVHVDVEGMGMVVGEDDGMVANFDLSFVLDTPASPMFPLDSKSKGAPPQHVKGRGLSILMGCEGDRVVIASKNVATAWSATDGSMSWTTTIDGEIPYTGTAPKKGIGIICNSIGVAKGIAKIPVGAGKFASLKITDGSKSP